MRARESDRASATVSPSDREYLAIQPVEELDDGLGVTKVRLSHPLQLCLILDRLPERHGTAHFQHLRAHAPHVSRASHRRTLDELAN